MEDDGGRCVGAAWSLKRLRPIFLECTASQREGEGLLHYQVKSMPGRGALVEQAVELDVVEQARVEQAAAGGVAGEGDVVDPQQLVTAAEGDVLRQAVAEREVDLADNVLVVRLSANPPMKLLPWYSKMPPSARCCRSSQPLFRRLAIQRFVGRASEVVGADLGAVEAVVEFVGAVCVTLPLSL